VAPSTDDQSEPYRTVLSRYEKKKLRAKRRRERSRENASGDPTTDDTDGEATVAIQNAAATAKKLKKGTRLLVGTKIDQINRSNTNSTDAVVSQNDTVAAAKPYISKAVFCVDNVATHVEADDIVQLVTNMGVRVITCFKVDPRRPEWQRKRGITPKDRRTFRLCISRDDCDKLLNAGMWPEHISISRWIFNKTPRPYVPAATERDNRSVSPSKRELTDSINNESSGGTIAADSAAITASYAAVADSENEIDSHEYYLGLKNYPPFNKPRHYNY